jgi:hypothetical protein
MVRFVQGWNVAIKQGDRNNDKKTKKEKKKKDERMEDKTRYD